MKNAGRFHHKKGLWARRSEQRGQTVVFVVLGLGLVFLAVLGFAIDFGDMWFHRQTAQSTADAVCTAAAMDMLYNVEATPTTPVGGFTPGTAFDCTVAGGNSGSGPCAYGALNGYSGSGLIANAASNRIQVTFPSSVSGLSTLTFPLSPGSVSAPPVSLAPNPFVQVTVTDRIRTAFFGLVSSSRTIDVPAKSTCGLVVTTSPIPILILDPTRKNTFIMDGGSQTTIYGGPPDSIQINSSNALAFDKNGNSGFIDLHQGGPTTSGSNFHVAIPQTNPPSTGQTCGSVDLCTGTTGSYGTHLPILDPLASLTAPSIPTWTGTAPATNGSSRVVLSPTDGCPALPAGTPCTEYFPGYYPSEIKVGGSNPNYAIFAPGIYYIEGGMTFASNSCVRPATVDGDGSGGTFFYFADNKSISVVANSGCNTGPNTTATNFNTTTGFNPYTHGVYCDATAAAGGPPLPASIAGSVLLAPCTKPNAGLSMCNPNCTINGSTGYGDPLGTSDPAGTQRGELFFQNRNQTLSNTNMPSWQGGGDFLVSGTMYFHQCKTTGGVDTGGTGCTTSAFTDQLTIGGNSSGTSYVLGDVIVDQLQLNGTSGLTMDLNPSSIFVVFKASLLQ
jgi:hypothetical protein